MRILVWLILSLTAIIIDSCPVLCNFRWPFCSTVFFFLFLLFELLHLRIFFFFCLTTGSALLYFCVRLFFSRLCNCVYRFPSTPLSLLGPLYLCRWSRYLENWPQFCFFGSPVVSIHFCVWKTVSVEIYDILEMFLKHDFLLMSRSRVKEYLPITGLAEFNKLSAKLIFGADRYFSWDLSTHSSRWWYL